MANQFLSLALFLMLLSFFIVMNAVSSFENHKTQPVMNSISLAFSGQSPASDAVNVIEEANPIIVDNPGDTLESIEGLFNAHLAGFEASRNRFGTVMHVRTSVGDFEKAIDFSGDISAQLSVDNRGSFMLSMITMLRSEELGKPYSVDLVLNIPENSSIYQKKSPNEFIRSLKRVSGFAGKLEKSGLPKKLMSVGLAKGESGFIDLYFSRYKRFDMIDEIKKSEEQ